MQMYNREKT